MENHEKQFLLYWGEGYINASPLVVQGLARFSDNWGYSEESRQLIENMPEGELLDLTDLSGKHYIIRVN